MRSLFTAKSLLTLITLLIPAAKVLAGDQITINSGFYHIDNKSHIIVINQATDNINEDNTEVKNVLILDKSYTFTQPILSVNTSKPYQVRFASTLYNVYFTHLPIIHIDAKTEIVDAPSVSAKFKMSELGGAITESNAGIEIRGGYSQSYPKKSYELSFWNDTLGTSSRDVTLLHMRNDDKWNLLAMYNEPLRLNNKVSEELWQNIHQIYYKDKEPDAKNGIAMEYVELFVNNEYKGIYALSERIDKKQLKLKKYNAGIKGELYKGSDWGDAVTFRSAPAYDNTSTFWGGFEYKEPEEKVDWKNLSNFVSFVTTSNNTDFNNHYQQYFRLDNAVDYYIFLNLTRATDNTGKNIYIAKYKSDEPYYYAPWDLDGVFGYNWLGQQDNTTDDILTNGFYNRLVQDCSPTGFRATLLNRWAKLRATIITEDNILSKFKANNNYLLVNNIYEREHLAWNGFTYDEKQLAFISIWLKNRLAYLDAQFSQPCQVTNKALSTTTGQQNTSLKLYPNPTSDYLFIESDASPSEICIRDVTGKSILESTLSGKVNKITISHLPKGLYIISIKSDNVIKTEKLLIN